MCATRATWWSRSTRCCSGWCRIVYVSPSPAYGAVFALNPVAALVMALRDILLDGMPPASSLPRKLSVGSVAGAGSGAGGLPADEAGVLRLSVRDQALFRMSSSMAARSTWLSLV